MNRTQTVENRNCRKLLCGGSRSFYLASFLLPGAVRGPATALYAYCRVVDDAIDEGGGPQVFDHLTRQLDQVYAGQPRNHPVDRAFARVVADYGIPRALPEALLEGMLWDVQGRHYRTLSDVYAYGSRVAGSVGAMMALLMGATTPQLLARATDLGVAMQLTNIARDVGEDARNGRLYLPQTWLHEAGIDHQQFLQNPRWTPALGQVVSRLLEAAGSLYRRADAGIDGLPLSCRFGIRAARSFYAEIGHQLDRQGLDSVNRRAIVPTSRKIGLTLALVGKMLAPRRPVHAPALAQNQFLVDAVPQAAGELWSAKAGFFQPLARSIALIEKLERRDRAMSFGDLSSLDRAERS